MRIATIIFTYNRSAHTKKVLNALKENTVLPEKLFVFQDGLKCKEHMEEWVKVNCLVKSIDWCDCELVVSKINKGLAKSIVSGVERVLEQYDAIIVFEDDCLPHSGFMKFMTDALKKYHNKKEVFSVSGYTYPVSVEQNGTDAYFTRRISSWGWGTWKDRWEYFDRDYRVLGRIKKNAELAKQLHIWGEDLENILLGNIYGECDSWAVFWALNVIERKGYCLTPYKSLIKNIGLDGTGVHCNEEIVQVLEENKHKSDFCLPDTIEIPPNCDDKFSDHFSWVPVEKKMYSYNCLLIKWVKCLLEHKPTVADKLKKSGVKKCSIWGKGKICDLLIEDLRGTVKILSIIESHPTVNEYRGIPVLGVNELSLEEQLIIVIPIYDMEKIKRVRKIDTLVPLDKLLEE